MLFFFFNDTATTEIYTLSLHDALPICDARRPHLRRRLPLGRRRPVPVQELPRLAAAEERGAAGRGGPGIDRKSTRLNSSHANISYAVFCLKKKNYTARYHSLAIHTSIL